MKKHLNTLIAGAAALALAGCMVGPDYVPPTAEIAKQDLSEEHFFRDDGLWKEAAPAESLPKGDWWKIFNDPVLNSILEQCKKNNPSLSAAFYRVEQARQNARMDEAQLYPQMNGNASFMRTATSKNLTQAYSRYDKWTTGLGMTWDLDLFGRVMSIIESDVATAQATLDAYNSLMLSMQAQVAKSYFSIRQYYSEVELLERTLEVRKEQTKLISDRVKLDFASDLDLQRAIEQEAEAAGCRVQAEAILSGQSELLAQSGQLAETIAAHKADLASVTANREGALRRAADLRQLAAELSGDRSQKEAALAQYRQQIGTAQEEIGRRKRN